MSSTRNQILEKARYLFQKKGYSGFAYRHIAEPLGIRNAAVHYHFPSKTDLGVALIERYRDVLRKGTSEFMRHGGDPLVQIEGYFLFCRHEYSECDRICPIGIMAGDYYNLPEKMRETGRLLVEETLAWLTKVLELGREEGIFGFEGKPAAKALMLQAALQGAAEIGRITGNRGLYEDAIAQARTDLGLPQQTADSTVEDATKLLRQSGSKNLQDAAQAQARRDASPPES